MTFKPKIRDIPKEVLNNENTKLHKVSKGVNKFLER